MFLPFLFFFFLFWGDNPKDVKQINEKQHLTGDALVASQLTALHHEEGNIGF